MTQCGMWLYQRDGRETVRCTRVATHGRPGHGPEVCWQHARVRVDGTSDVRQPPTGAL